MVLELLGPNLQDLMTMCGGKFSLKCSLLLVIQIFEKIEYLHTKGYVYRDIKP
jgi:serine/threonine protein kinase